MSWSGPSPTGSVDQKLCPSLTYLRVVPVPEDSSDAGADDALSLYIEASCLLRNSLPEIIFSTVFTHSFKNAFVTRLNSLIAPLSESFPPSFFSSERLEGALAYEVPRSIIGLREPRFDLFRGRKLVQGLPSTRHATTTYGRTVELKLFGAAAAGHGFGLAVRLNVQRSRSDTSYGHHGEAPSYGRVHGDGWCLGILG